MTTAPFVDEGGTAALHTISDLERQLRISRSGIRRLIQSGELPAQLIAGKWQVAADDLAVFVAARRNVGRGQ